MVLISPGSTVEGQKGHSSRLQHFQTDRDLKYICFSFQPRKLRPEIGAIGLWSEAEVEFTPRPLTAS